MFNLMGQGASPPQQNQFLYDAHQAIMRSYRSTVTRPWPAAPGGPSPSC